MAAQDNESEFRGLIEEAKSQIGKMLNPSYFSANDNLALLEEGIRSGDQKFQLLPQ